MSLSREEFYSEAETKHHACCCITFPSKQEKIEKALEKAGWQKLGEETVKTRRLPSSSRFPCSIVSVEQKGTIATYQKSTI